MCLSQANPAGLGLNRRKGKERKRGEQRRGRRRRMRSREEELETLLKVLLLNSKEKCVRVFCTARSSYSFSLNLGGNYVKDS